MEIRRLVSKPESSKNRRQRRFNPPLKMRKLEAAPLHKGFQLNLSQATVRDARPHFFAYLNSGIASSEPFVAPGSWILFSLILRLWNGTATK